MQNKTILFNGFSGSIGSNMTLKKNIISIKSRLEDKETDIVKELSYYKADIFIHFAAITNKKVCEKFKQKCLKINHNGAIKMYKLAIKSNIKRFIFVSTSDVYKPTNSIKLISTNSRLEPDSYYSEIKLKTEKELLRLSKLNKNTKLSVARIFNITSKKLRKNSLEEKIHKLANLKKIEYIEDLNKVRDISSAKKVCNDLIKLAKSSSFPKLVNICSEKPILLYDYVAKIYKKYNIDFKNSYQFKVPKLKNNLVGKKTQF